MSSVSVFWALTLNGNSSEVAKILNDKIEKINMKNKIQLYVMPKVNAQSKSYRTKF